MTASQTVPVPAEGGAVRSHRSFRWFLLANMVTVFFSSYFIRLAWSNVSASASQTLGSSATELGLFFTLFYAGYVPANITGGFLIDRFGGRRVLLTAFALFTCATASFGLIRTLFEGLVVQTLMGLTAGSFYAATIKIASPWFSERERGLAFGFLAMTSPLAVIGANLIFPYAIAQIGWSNLYRCLGVYGAAVAIVTFLVVPAHAPQTRTVAPAIGPDRPRASGRSGTSAGARLLLVCLAGFGASWGTYGFTMSSNLLLVRSGHFAAAQAATVVLMFGAGGLLGMPLYGLLSDRIAGFRPQLIIAGLLILPMALLLFGTRTTFPGFCVAGFLLGISAYAFWPLFSAILADLMDPRRLGSSAGLANACWQSANVLVPLAAGAVVDATHSLSMSLLVLAVGPLGGAVCMLLLVRSIRAGVPAAVAA